VVPFYEDGKRMAKKGLRGSDRLIGLKIIINIITGILSGKFNLRGPISCGSFGAITGALEMMDAVNYIKVGMADVMLVGTSDVCVNPHVYTILGNAAKLHPGKGNPEEACRPFDKHR
jgi:3-oxoacyl-[acyl-carrier-protein] synthase II